MTSPLRAGQAAPGQQITSRAATPPARPDDQHDRARTLLHILRTMLDRTPGLRDALPRLRELEQTLPQRGMAALNDAPLPTLRDVQSALGRLLPHESPAMLQSRAQLLSSLDRRKKPRKADMPTFINNRDLFAGEASISDFMDALDPTVRP